VASDIAANLNFLFVIFLLLLSSSVSHQYSQFLHEKHPDKKKKAPHQPNGWYNALRFVL